MTDNITEHELTPEIVEQIKLHIIEINHKIVESISDLNVELLFEVFDRESTVFINNTVIFDDLNSAYGRFKSYYSTLESFEITLTSWETKVLSPEIALNYVNAIEQITAKNGNISNNNVSWTSVFHKNGSRWKIIHFHQSVLPME